MADPQGKQPFDIDEVMARVRDFVRELPAPSMFQLRAEGFATPFEQLVACIISIRTMEETSLPVSRALFAVARTPETMAALPVERIEAAIHSSTFSERKAAQIKEIARIVVERFGGDLPCDGEVMQSFAGVGPKCANLALGIACGQPTIPVDIHVHRVTNRWGYVQTKTPEQTLVALEAVLPTAYRPEINELLVPFGKYHCTGVRPKCSACPVLEMCRKVGVTSHR
jgi:endonuclease-3